LLAQSQNDRRLILKALSEYKEYEDNPNVGRYELNMQELIDLTQLPAPRIEDAIELLQRDELLDAKSR